VVARDDKWRVVALFEGCEWLEEPQISPLRFAPVETTNLWLRLRLVR
jgi:hypothetical protein